MMRFIEIEVTYPSPNICCYQEYKGKPYYNIKYEEDGEFFVGFGTYNPKVLSRYIKEYFIKQKDMLPKHFSLPRSAREQEDMC